MCPLLPVFLLAACSTSHDAWPPSPGEHLLDDRPTEQPMLPPPGVDLFLDVTDVVPGEQATLTAYDADPGETVVFLRSTSGVGSGPCPPALGGQCLDINGPITVANTAIADAQGVATLSFTVPAGAPNGVTVWFEAAAKRGVGFVDSVTSNPVERVLGDATPYAHTITVDGDGSDWTAEEAFDTTSGIGQTWVSWDADLLYVGLQHPDVANGGPEHWSVIYLATSAPGTASGITHNTQTPGLPFEASHAIRRKADGSFDSLLTWDGTAWAETPGWLGTQGSQVAEGGDLLELAIPRSLLGGDRVWVATAFVFEGNGYESTFAGSPATSFVDGYDPDLGNYLDFDLSSSASPSAQN